MRPAPNETTLRRPGFAPGHAVTLSDGQTWHFAVPITGDYYPVWRDGEWRYVSGFTFGHEYDRLTDELIASTDGYERTVLMTELAFLLLSRNYELEREDMRYLLRRASMDQEATDPDAFARNASMWDAIRDIALGVVPKPIPIG